MTLDKEVIDERGESYRLGGLVLYFIKPTFFYWFIKLGIKYFTFITFLIKSHFAKPRAVTFINYFAKVKNE